MCAKCAQPFVSGSILTALDRKWHPDCFLCTICRGKLANQSFHVKDDSPYCTKCWKENFQPRCALPSERRSQMKPANIPLFMETLSYGSGLKDLSITTAVSLFTKGGAVVVLFGGNLLSS
ncbi:hypothetical protein CRM22_003114 [Opisthorchis felineus]|uniref:LIM zinc-binding domain-containing protein n=1 Tax=Opisthorchis felineus TaxID=147828 RepID=A0A4S2M943_OPIFE|nr:hypothetical protein CRM22_003114 [Opisthorchis felineus]